MKKINVVKSHEEFNSIMNKGKCLKNKYFVMYSIPNNLDKYRFGIYNEKKVCNAVNRNRLKRQVRNILEYHKNLYSKSKDYIIIVRKSSLNEKYSCLEENLVNLLKKMEENNE